MIFRMAVFPTILGLAQGRCIQKGGLGLSPSPPGRSLRAANAPRPLNPSSGMRRQWVCGRFFRLKAPITCTGKAAGTLGSWEQRIEGDS